MHVTPRAARGSTIGPLLARKTSLAGFSGTAAALGLTAAIRLIPAAADEQPRADLFLQRACFFDQRIEALEERGELLGREMGTISHDESIGDAPPLSPRIANSGYSGKAEPFPNAYRTVIYGIHLACKFAGGDV